MILIKLLIVSDVYHSSEQFIMILIKLLIVSDVYHSSEQYFSYNHEENMLTNNTSFR
jgi:hypothetical protein